LQRAIRLRPGWALAHCHLASLLHAQRRLSEAEVAYRRTLELSPDNVSALNNLAADVLNNEGRIDEARAAYRQALALQPDRADCHSNMLLNEQYAPGVTRAGLAQAHAEWEARHGLPLRTTWRPFAQTREPDRPLRVGFVAGDFFYHPVGLFLAPILERLDRQKWPTVCYASQQKRDELTARLTRAAGLWRWVADLDDEKLAEQARADGIDLLVDLSGHTGRNRLLTFARRPAPVQLTWMGYVGTTGLSAIDYLIADRFHVPPGWEGDYREKVLRLPDGYLCWEAPPYAPPVGPLPALASGQVTFGSFNNIAKINAEVVSIWAAVLARLPGARLVLKYHWLDDEGLRRRLTEQFAARGIAPDRLELLGSTTHVEQLQQYNRIDLALDPFPYSGGLTTCESCWMGVPVLTCPGETFASRHSLSYLSNIGLTETIVANREEYVARAVALAGDLPRLAELRAGLRGRMAGSPVCDVDRFTEHLTAAWRQAWRAWCAGP
jgi:predicted O-linked N-acetylglucosamine transferase (SPINDLY family)